MTSEEKITSLQSQLAESVTISLSWRGRAEKAESQLAKSDERAREAEGRLGEAVKALEEIEEMTSNGEPYHGDMAWQVSTEALARIQSPDTKIAEK